MRPLHAGAPFERTPLPTGGGSGTAGRGGPEGKHLIFLIAQGEGRPTLIFGLSAIDILTWNWYNRIRDDGLSVHTLCGRNRRRESPSTIDG